MYYPTVLSTLVFNRVSNKNEIYSYLYLSQLAQRRFETNLAMAIVEGMKYESHLFTKLDSFKELVPKIGESFLKDEVKLYTLDISLAYELFEFLHKIGFKDIKKVVTEYIKCRLARNNVKLTDMAKYGLYCKLESQFGDPDTALTYKLFRETLTLHQTSTVVDSNSYIMLRNMIESSMLYNDIEAAYDMIKRAVIHENKLSQVDVFDLLEQNIKYPQTSQKVPTMLLESPCAQPTQLATRAEFWKEFERRVGDELDALKGTHFYVTGSWISRFLNGISNPEDTDVDIFYTKEYHNKVTNLLMQMQEKGYTVTVQNGSIYNAVKSDAHMSGKKFQFMPAPNKTKEVPEPLYKTILEFDYSNCQLFIDMSEEQKTLYATALGFTDLILNTNTFRYKIATKHRMEKLMKVRATTRFFNPFAFMKENIIYRTQEDVPKVLEAIKDAVREEQVQKPFVFATDRDPDTQKTVNYIKTRQRYDNVKIDNDLVSINTLKELEILKHVNVPCTVNTDKTVTFSPDHTKTLASVGCEPEEMVVDELQNLAPNTNVWADVDFELREIWVMYQTEGEKPTKYQQKAFDF